MLVYKSETLYSFVPWKYCCGFSNLIEASSTIFEYEILLSSSTKGFASVPVSHMFVNQSEKSKKGKIVIRD